MGQPQRVLLPAGSHLRNILNGQSFRQADLGQRLRRRRAPGTGNIKWEHRVLTPPWGGVMATAGNLVFGGTLEGMIFALNATTGERLWTFSSNGPVFASPISYTANGKQLISIPAGDLIVTF